MCRAESSRTSSKTLASLAINSISENSKARNGRASAGSASRFPRPRVRGTTSEGFRLEKTSALDTNYTDSTRTERRQNDDTRPAVLDSCQFVSTFRASERQVFGASTLWRAWEAKFVSENVCVSIQPRMDSDEHGFNSPQRNAKSAIEFKVGERTFDRSAVD